MYINMCIHILFMYVYIVDLEVSTFFLKHTEVSLRGLADSYRCPIRQSWVPSAV